MTYAEAVKIIEERLPGYADATEALAVLTALAEENERLSQHHADSKEQLKTLLRIRQENAALKAEAEDAKVVMKAMTLEIGNLKAEVEELTDRHKIDLMELDAQMKTEDALKEQLRIVHGELRHECEVAEKAEAELERARPLLEAVEKAQMMASADRPNDIVILDEDVATIIQKSLAYRSAK